MKIDPHRLRTLPFALAMLLAGCGGSPIRLAPPGGPLQPCPSTPNCVFTGAGDARHAMQPLPFTGAPRQAQARARAALLAEPRTRIVTERPGYLHAEARSRVFRFVDDVEVLVDSAASVVRFRSASRVGHGDLGVNRARMKRFGDRFRASADGASATSRHGRGGTADARQPRVKHPSPQRVVQKAQLIASTRCTGGGHGLQALVTGPG